jgi:hypothetical protein
MLSERLSPIQSRLGVFARLKNGRIRNVSAGQRALENSKAQISATERGISFSLTDMSPGKVTGKDSQTNLGLQRK